ncbi:hypothetical protein VOLCADRAFT_93628 [Volvox carteri f. nagariensis]|uniref:Uncharacterized protein n=1 Tax=Volvox carteri f. nagariensis TaxID=3068 RepID=D8U2L8_VOLCA|nr:uncharacterized protein VOLCADRAFT_93628 [Volvox carteri f. nagariensis]EFJ46084.1 hypothetical protein VOLCADRAFT_93628 [Volvox carteri f. nagariensis]|eukprot:XP_002952834.1 hypothetical protein VOLCADRAFT_93628 [Volvox carteri f. nagariensis]
MVRCSLNCTLNCMFNCMSSCVVGCALKHASRRMSNCAVQCGQCFAIRVFNRGAVRCNAVQCGVHNKAVRPDAPGHIARAQMLCSAVRDDAVRFTVWCAVQNEKKNTKNDDDGRQIAWFGAR